MKALERHIMLEEFAMLIAVDGEAVSVETASHWTLVQWMNDLFPVIPRVSSVMHWSHHTHNAVLQSLCSQ